MYNRGDPEYYICRQMNISKRTYAGYKQYARKNIRLEE